jgi:HAD superfamily hydrolase (TIGR01549 family)
MIKAVYFDWFNTLATYDPAREQLYCDAFKENGIDIPFIQVYRGVMEGDRRYFSLISHGLTKNKSRQEMDEIFTLYPEAICRAAGLSASHEVYLKVIRQVLKQYTGRMVLFKDVLPTFEELKKRDYVLGIITNANSSIIEIIYSLGLKPYLRAVITSEQAGAEKPDPAIFQAAYAQGKFKPEEMAYIGDTYKSDILGASKAGSKGILLDRYGIETEITDGPRISTLSQVLEYV